jgi:hypothetical protein
MRAFDIKESLLYFLRVVSMNHHAWKCFYGCTAASAFQEKRWSSHPCGFPNGLHHIVISAVVRARLLL